MAMTLMWLFTHGNARKSFGQFWKKWLIQLRGVYFQANTLNTDYYRHQDHKRHTS